MDLASSIKSQLIITISLIHDEFFCLHDNEASGKYTTAMPEVGSW